MKVLMVHPGASWSTADVHNGLRFGLSACDVQTAVYQLDVRISRSGRWLMWNWRLSGKQGEKPTARDVGYHASIGVLERALRLEPDWVLVVSGMYLDMDAVAYLRRCGFKLACLLTESPYDDDAQARYLSNFHVAWTNERTSVARLQAAVPDVRVGYLGPAWHPLVHVQRAPEPGTPAHDVLFVGTAFPERTKLLSAVRWPDGADVALYGHWNSLGSRSRLRPLVRGGVVGNEQAADLYRAAKVNLNLMRRRKGWGGDGAQEVEAESVNPRVMELAALGRFFLTDHRAELDTLFGPRLVPTFDGPRELEEQVAAWLALGPGARDAVGDALRERVAEHSWVHRAEQVLRDLRAWEAAQ